MSNLGKVYFGSFLLLLLPAWLFQRSLEASGSSDALGLWYTVYCVAFWSLIAAGGITSLVALQQRIRHAATPR